MNQKLIIISFLIFTCFSAHAYEVRNGSESIDKYTVMNANAVKIGNLKLGFHFQYGSIDISDYIDRGSFSSGIKQDGSIVKISPYSILVLGKSKKNNSSFDRSLEIKLYMVNDQFGVVRKLYKIHYRDTSKNIDITAEGLPIFMGEYYASGPLIGIEEEKGTAVFFEWLKHWFSKNNFPIENE